MTEDGNGLCVGDGVVDWVVEKIGGSTGLKDAQGIGWRKDGKIVMGAFFHNYNKASIYMHIALTKGTALSPTFVAAIMDYPCRQLGVKRVTGLIAESNLLSRRFAEHLGAKMEGTLQDALIDGNLILYGLLRKDAAKWLTAAYSKRLIHGGSDERPVREK